MDGEVRIEVQHGDALEFPSDVLLLKYANGLHGADRAVFDRLYPHAVTFDDETDEYTLDASHRGILPKPDGYRFVSTQGRISPPECLVLGVGPLRSFEYEAMRRFGRRGIEALAGERPQAEVMSAPISGPGFGLDELESLKALVAGFVDAITAGDLPASLERVVIVERSGGRARRLRDALDALVPQGVVSADRTTFERSLDPVAATGSRGPALDPTTNG